MPHRHPHIEPSPWPKRIVLTIVALVTLVLAYAGLEIYWALTAKPNPTVDYAAQIHDLVVESQKDLEGEDAWPLLVQALNEYEDWVAELDEANADVPFWSEQRFQTITDFDGIAEYVRDRRVSDDRSLEKQLADLEAARDVARRALPTLDDTRVSDLLDRLSKSERAIRPPYPSSTGHALIDALLPELGRMRDLARTISARMRIAEEAGDWPEYLRGFERLLALGRCSMQQGTLIERLVGIAVRALAIGRVRDDVMTGRLPADVCGDLQAALRRDADVPPISLQFSVEHLIFMDLIQWSHTKHGRFIVAGSALDPSPAATTANRLLNVLSLFRPRRAQQERWATTAYNQAAELAGLTPAQLRAQGTSVSAPFSSLPAAAEFIRLTAPALDSATAVEAMIRLETEGLGVLLAIERYRAETKRLPETLDALVPDYLDGLPADIYADGHPPLRYRILDQPDEHARDYLLYSVGHDGIDNAGLESAGVPQSALNGKEPGTDFIINRPD